MIDTSRQYTKKEAEELEALGYEFVSIASLAEPRDMYVVAAFNPPMRTRYEDQWERFID